MVEWMYENVMSREALLEDRLVTLGVNLREAYIRLEQSEGAEMVHLDQLRKLSGSGWLPRLALDWEVGEEMKGG
jgi:hypothetical protein